MNPLAKLTGAFGGWKGYAAALSAGAIVAGGAAWKVQGWRYGAEVAAMKADQSARVAESRRQAREILERRVAEVGQINERNAKAEWAAYGGMRNAQVQNDALRADVDAGRQRLHVAATCSPASSGLPQTGAGARVGDGARAELDPGARSDYFALRAGIQRVTAQLEACQARSR
ncbi:lysis protein [Achromobacter sp. B7]|uniref:lysis system i-spanin subunit Rz n=1 Tax=Achromobacter sp. B7 TaxID=2282475 RepID=UPI000E76804B|nr:lysis system i-spanin subunit Rz [Achromobacter sp. B7]AYD65289.1 lysis protein [Achromobacter sp. B7]